LQNSRHAFHGDVHRRDTPARVQPRDGRFMQSIEGTWSINGTAERSKGARTSQKLREQHAPRERARRQGSFTLFIHARRMRRDGAESAGHEATQASNTQASTTCGQHSVPENAMAKTSSGKEETPLLDIW
jgi:hypothetical protein